MADLIAHVASPAWAYALLLALLVADAFVPVVPTQIVMITSGALTVYGGLSLPLTIAVGAAGVFVGDLACYLLGRTAPARRAARHATPGRTRRAVARATRRLREPGPLVILLCRFVPGGRMAACFSAGRRRYPYRLFLAYDAVAAIGWAGYGTLVGHLGGAALTGSAWRLLLIGGVAAGGFAAAGWAMTWLGARQAATPSAGDLVEGESIMNDGANRREIRAGAQRLDPTWNDPERVARRRQLSEQMLAAVDGAQPVPAGEEPDRAGTPVD
ncbi:VTT domain-containing protein [Micromonospora sp. WMMD980]|uniref:DedA family protein n=1 Tax=Micromonospora sp. WMMD980 TaxID=3016088 RepID=UPI002417D9C0|nr:VTT domain-containing protein [Micromonospora sp. WMMD980]MDG4802961.1 VTT domain-containing protein [Micromonospora sp. WMMD980]